MQHDLPWNLMNLVDLDTDRRRLLELTDEIQRDTDQMREQYQQRDEDTALSELRRLYGGGAQC